MDLSGRKNPNFASRRDLSGIRDVTKRKAPPKDPEKSAIYAAKTPEPNYSEFGKKGSIQYVDRDGREYRLAEPSSSLVRSHKRASLSGPWKPFVEPGRLERNANYGTQVFWIRIPIYLRGNVDRPNPMGSTLSLYFIREQILCSGTTDGVFFSGPKKKTGYVMLKNFTVIGPTPDPSYFERLFVTEEGRKDYERKKRRI